MEFGQLRHQVAGDLVGEPVHVRARAERRGERHRCTLRSQQLSHRAIAVILLQLEDARLRPTLDDATAILDRGRLLALESADAIKQRYEADTLEEAFFAATGREFEAEADEDDDREVFA